MRSFKFFFAASVMVILFFFLARVFLTAFVVAVVLSLVFGVFRKIRSFIADNDEWEDYSHKQYEFPKWHDGSEPLFEAWAKRPMRQYRPIEVRSSDFV